MSEANHTNTHTYNAMYANCGQFTMQFKKFYDERGRERKFYAPRNHHANTNALTWRDISQWGDKIKLLLANSEVR